MCPARRLAALLAVLLAALPATAAADDASTHGLPLPPGTRADDGRFISSRGFRDTVKFYARRLERRGAPHRALPVYRRRGIDIARFLSTREESSWAAIHVYRRRGTTYIAIVGAQPLDPAE